MSRKRKTPPHLIALIEDHWRQMEYIEEVLRVKRTAPLENQADHVRKSEDYWLGLARGYSSMLERALHDWNCYAGFAYMSEKKLMPSELSGPPSMYRTSVGDTAPDFAEWRVQYWVRG